MSKSTHPALEQFKRFVSQCSIIELVELRREAKESGDRTVLAVVDAEFKTREMGDK